jgi:hypothetical protein
VLSASALSYEAAAADSAAAEEATMTEAELEAALRAEPGLYPVAPVVEAIELVTKAEPAAESGP